MELRPYQQDAIVLVKNSLAKGNKRIVVALATGGGKCFSGNTTILLSDGRVKQAKDIVIGDRLMGPDGAERNVLSLASGIDKMYRIIPVKGDSYVVNAGHILSLRKTPGSKAVIFSDGRRIAPDSDIVNVNVEVFANSNATAHHVLKGWRSDAVEFHNEKTELKLDPYWLGCWLGDGDSNRPKITKGKCKMVDWFISHAESKNHSVTESSKGDNHSGFNIRNRNGDNEFTKYLREYGLIDNKHIPEDYKLSCISDRLKLIAGLLDSDGSLAHNGYDWISCREKLAEDFAFMCRSVGLSAYVAPCKKGIKTTGFVGDYWRVSVSGDTDKIPCLDKIASQRMQKKRHLVHGIKIEPLGDGEYFGFEVDGDKLFLLGDFTVTHNSLICESIISGALAKGKRVMFVVNRVQLAEQMSAHLSRGKISHGMLQGANTRAEYENCVIASIDTIHKRGYPEVDLILMDEGHACAASAKYHKMLEHYKDIPCLAVTATWWARGMAKTYEWGQLFQDIVCPITIPELIGQGYLVDVDVYAPGEPDMTGVRQRKNQFGEMDYSDDDAAAAADKPKLIGDIFASWGKLAFNKKTIVFATNIAHSKHIVEEFKKNGVSACHIDYLLEQDEKRDILARFKRNEFTVLSNCALLSEGFDDPETEAMILARPTKSLIRFIQMAGRVLRPYAGKERAILLDHSGSSKLLGSPTDAQPVELDDGKPRPKNEAKEKEREEKLAKACPSCSYMKKTHKCPICGFAPEKQNTVETAEGELVLMKKEKKQPKMATIDKRKLYAELKHLASDRKWSDGKLSNTFRDLAGVWPNAYKDAAPAHPTQETLKLVQHLNIKFAKSNSYKRYGAN